MRRPVWLRRQEHAALIEEARESRKRAEHDLARTREETPRIVRLARSLVEVQEENHLGPKIARAIRGGEQ